MRKRRIPRNPDKSEKAEPDEFDPDWDEEAEDREDLEFLLDRNAVTDLDDLQHELFALDDDDELGPLSDLSDL